ncbi:MAG TPA: hypothetical protein VKM55_24625 [Candidatus Lokiarchaeia archaeon]|nr:hypothetical protein [Candidatus Lokiarchaeia archaeon]
MDALEAFQAANPEHDVNPQSSAQVQGLLAERRVLDGMVQAMANGLPREDAVASLVNEMGEAFDQNWIFGSVATQMLSGQNGVSDFQDKMVGDIITDLAQIPAPEWLSAYILKASNNKDEYGPLNGGFLEVVKMVVTKADAAYLNGFRATGRTEAYDALLDYLIHGQDTSVLNGRSYTWIDRASGTQFQEDVGLDAAESDASGHIIMHSVGEYEYDHSYLSRLSECKSMDPALGYSTTTKTVIQAVKEMYSYLVREIMYHQDGNLVGVEFFLNQLKPVQYQGMNGVPQFMQAAFDLVSEQEIQGLSYLILRPAGSARQLPYAWVDLSSTALTFDTSARTATITFDFYQMDPTTGTYELTPMHASGIISWENGPPRSDAFINWLFHQLQNQAWRNHLQGLTNSKLT